jgi:hypothetical protein
MNRISLLGWSSALCLSVVLVQAQETNEVEQLKKQMQQMQQQIETLTRKLDEVAKAQAPPPAAAPKTAEQKRLEEQLAAELAKGAATSAASTNVRLSVESKQAWSPTQPITIARAGSAYMNIGLDLLLDAGGSTAADPSATLQLGDHDPHKRGFTLPNAEISLDGAVDPYFKGFANIVFKLDNDNETELELEEAYLVSTSLPANLQLKAGQFFANFGRQNPQHPHSWAFVDQPIILNRAFGPDGVRNLGAQVSWLAPTPFYSEVFLGILDGQGGTAFSFRNQGEDDGTGVNRFAGRATSDRKVRGPQDLVFTPRIASSMEISDTQTLVAGLSGAFGANDTGPLSRTETYGADIYWKWKPANADKGFPFLSWQTEALYRRFGAGADPLAPTPLPAENLRDWGMYSQLLWGFHPRWVAGLRGDYASGNTGAFDANDVFRGERYRVAPALTFLPSEFSKVRLQYNHDQGELIGMEHSVWLQLEFMLGAHAAHKF